MNIFTHRGFTVCVFHGQDQDEIDEVFAIQASTGLGGGNINELLYVPMEGYKGTSLRKDRFLITDPTASLSNHMMWNEIWTKEEQDLHIVKMIDKYIDTKKQAVIENYEYVAEEPFYDYSGGK